MTTASASASAPCQCGTAHDHEYQQFLDRLNQRFLANCGNGTVPLFYTEPIDLWTIYLRAFADPTERQRNNCHACRAFIQHYGSLVTIAEDGSTTPVFWDETDAPETYRPAVAALAKAVRRAKVGSVFLASSELWGTPRTGHWQHLAVNCPPGMIFDEHICTATQAMAAKLEDFRTVCRALADFDRQALETAVQLLRTDSLYRSEKILGQAEWLLDLHKAWTASRRKANVVWLAVAAAPAGFCHPRSGMIGSLLEDIVAGKDYETVAKAFAAKMHPLQYQRPQAPPKAGAIDAAEKLFAKLQAAGSLERRFCRPDEVRTIWTPRDAGTKDKPAGVFGHLRRHEEKPYDCMVVPAQTMTWCKFRDTVLPHAEQIDWQLHYHDHYTALVTAVHPDAPPILQWDLPENRNPVSWYVWSGGSSSAQFSLPSSGYRKVTGIALKPSMWNGGFEHQGEGVIFLLDGAHETRCPGACLFPEILKSEFHGIRSVIEAHSKASSLAGQDQQHAAGVLLHKSSAWDSSVRVWINGRGTDYKLDRWD